MPGNVITVVARTSSELPWVPEGTTIDLMIPSGDTKICAMAFIGCQEITSVVIPHGMVEIKESAFMDCRNLTTLVLPSTVRIIGTAAFSECWSLREVHLPNRLLSCGERAFFGCRSLQEIIIPDLVECLDKAFAECDHLVVAIFRERDIAKILERRPYTTEFPTDTERRIFESCRSLRLVVGARGDRFKGTQDVEMVENTIESWYRAWRLQYWSRQTHHLCIPLGRFWIFQVMLAARRMRTEGLQIHIPEEMWITIFGFLRRTDLTISATPLPEELVCARKHPKDIPKAPPEEPECTIC